MFQKFENSTLYDFYEAKSRFYEYFDNKIQHDSIFIDSLCGICTASALQRLHKHFKISRLKGSRDIYKIGSTGICLKAWKQKGHNSFKIEIFAIHQYYKLSKHATKEHKELLKYLLTKKSFNFNQVDLCHDTQKYLSFKDSALLESDTKQYKTTLYIHNRITQDVMCCYLKGQKNQQKGGLTSLSSNLKRYELKTPLQRLAQMEHKQPHTQKAQKSLKVSQKNAKENLKFPKKQSLEISRKHLKKLKRSPFNPLNKKYNINIILNLNSKSKYKYSTREFFKNLINTS